MIAEASLTTSYNGSACPGRQIYTCEGTGTEMTWTITPTVGSAFLFSAGPDPVSGVTRTVNGITATVSFSQSNGNFISTLSTVIGSSSGGAVVRCYNFNAPIGNVTIVVAGKLVYSPLCCIVT